MIVGREHLVGAHRDYDELMEMGADPAEVHPPPPHALHHPHAPHPGHMVHAPPPPHPHALALHPAPPYPGHHPHAAHPHAPHPAYGHPQGHPHHEHHEHHEEHEHHEQHHGGRRMRVVKEEPKNQRQFPIGFELANIAPGDEEDIEVKPQVLFRGERLAIAQSIARYFDVLDIKVGKDSQLAATGALTGEAFETRAVGVRMELDTAQPGIVITLRVKNIDTAAHDFRAVLYGAVLE
jgi:hypothetical protein